MFFLSSSVIKNILASNIFTSDLQLYDNLFRFIRGREKKEKEEGREDVVSIFRIPPSGWTSSRRSIIG